jgi:DNA repair photolyase
VRETVAIGAATDPYQPAEGRWGLTRGAIVALGEAATPFGLITRGPLVVRDLDVLVAAGRHADVSVTLSVPTLDREIWRRTEPGTAPPAQRLRAIRLLVDRGIRTSVGMAPILPGLSDRPELLEDVIRAARDAGATGVWANVLYLRPGTREHFLDHLARHWPELLPAYERLYARGAYVAKTVADPIRGRVRGLAVAHGIADRRAVRVEPPPALPVGAYVPAPGQLTLLPVA